MKMLAALTIVFLLLAGCSEPNVAPDPTTAPPTSSPTLTAIPTSIPPEDSRLAELAKLTPESQAIFMAGDELREGVSTIRTANGLVTALIPEEVLVEQQVGSEGEIFEVVYEWRPQRTLVDGTVLPAGWYELVEEPVRLRDGMLEMWNEERGSWSAPVLPEGAVVASWDLVDGPGEEDFALGVDAAGVPAVAVNAQTGEVVQAHAGMAIIDGVLYRLTGEENAFAAVAVPPELAGATARWNGESNRVELVDADGAVVGHVEDGAVVLEVVEPVEMDEEEASELYAERVMAELTERLANVEVTITSDLNGDRRTRALEDVNDGTVVIRDNQTGQELVERPDAAARIMRLLATQTAALILNPNWDNSKVDMSVIFDAYGDLTEGYSLDPFYARRPHKWYMSWWEQVAPKILERAMEQGGMWVPMWRETAPNDTGYVESMLVAQWIPLDAFRSVQWDMHWGVVSTDDVQFEGYENKGVIPVSYGGKGGAFGWIYAGSTSSLHVDGYDSLPGDGWNPRLHYVVNHFLRVLKLHALAINRMFTPNWEGEVETEQTHAFDYHGVADMFYAMVDDGTEVLGALEIAPLIATSQDE